MVPPPAAGPTDQPAATSSAADSASPHESAAQAWRQVAVQLAQIRAYASHYLQARIDAVKLTVRQLVIWAALGLVGLIALSTVAVMMVVFLFQGIAGAFGALFDGKLWLGDLVTMGIFVLLMVAGISWGMGAIRNAGRRRTVEKYESRQSQERINYGADIHQRASRS